MTARFVRICNIRLAMHLVITKAALFVISIVEVGKTNIHNRFAQPVLKYSPAY